MTTHTPPTVGLGLWKIPKQSCAQLVYEAIKHGYRNFDSACDYGNEKEVGEGLNRALNDGLCTREELRITSKLWNTYHKHEHVLLAVEKTIEDLGIAYLDSYLVHFPIALKFVPIETRYPPEWIADPNASQPRMETAPVPLHETWAAMEELVGAGIVHDIGICNYNSALLNDLMSYASIKPKDLQIESHPYLSQERLIRLAQSYGIHVTAFSPLGALSYLELDMASANESVLLHDAITSIAKIHGKTAAQVVLRWNIQRNVSVVTKTTKVERLKENMDVFDFSLSEAQMETISSLNCNRRFNDPGQFCEQAFNHFHPIYD